MWSWSIVRAINFASVVYAALFYNACALQIDCTTVPGMCVSVWLCMCVGACWAAPRLLSCMLLYQHERKKITYILKLRRFANFMIYPFLFLWFTFFWSYCEEQMPTCHYVFCARLVTDFFLKASLSVLFFQNTENIFQTLAFHSLRLQVLMSFWVLNY